MNMGMSARLSPRAQSWEEGRRGESWNGLYTIPIVPYFTDALHTSHGVMSRRMSPAM
jgi:hypothetical protein